MTTAITLSTEDYQAALLSRFGGDLSRTTLAASMVRVGQAVQPISICSATICWKPI
jgi:hypothetical protein